MPYYLSIGVTEEKFFDSNPKELEPYKLAQRIKDNRIDYYLWTLGIYMTSSIGGCFSKDAKYPDKPQFQYNVEDEYLTQEEIDNREIQKLLAQEELRAERLKAKFDNEETGAID